MILRKQKTLTNIKSSNLTRLNKNMSDTKKNLMKLKMKMKLTW